MSVKTRHGVLKANFKDLHLFEEFQLAPFSRSRVSDVQGDIQFIGDRQHGIDHNVREGIVCSVDNGRKGLTGERAVLGVGRDRAAAFIQHALD